MTRRAVASTRSGSTPLRVALGVGVIGCAVFALFEGSPTLRSILASASSTSAERDVSVSARSVPQAPARLASYRPITGAFGNYLAGRFATNEVDTKAAADRMLAAQRTDPEQADLLGPAFIAALLDGRGEVVRLANLATSNPAANLLLIGDDVLSNNWNRAEQRLDELLPSGVVEVVHPTLRAWIQLGRGQSEIALETLRPLVEADKVPALNALHAALIAELAGRPEDAARYARMAMEGQIDPPWRVASLAAGVLHRTGHSDEAHPMLDSIVTNGGDAGMAASEPIRRRILEVRDVTSPAAGMAETYTALASAVRRQGSGDLALVFAQLALRLRPAFAPAAVLVSDALGRHGHVAQALAALSGISADDPLFSVVALRRSNLLHRNGQADEALAVLRHVAEANPGRSHPWAWLGTLLSQLKRYPEAVQAYSKALDLLPADASGNWSLLYSRAIAHDLAGDWDKAEADLLRALELSPDEPFALNHLAYNWAEKGKNLDLAKDMLTRALEARPDDGNIADSLGWVYFRLGEVSQAVTWLEKAIELLPHASEINDHLGDAYWAAGRHREAVHQWLRALTLHLEPEHLTRIEAKIRERSPEHLPSTPPL